MHIGIAGNIGSGKTTLTKMLADHYGWIAKFESVEYNPYLDDYYKDIKRWSFNLEVYFLEKRFRDLIEISKSVDTIVQDRTILEGVYIFARNNLDMGNMSQRDFDTYMSLFDLMVSLSTMPDLLIYLRSSVAHLVDQIEKRGRDCEKKMDISYLTNLNNKYEEWISSYKGRILIIDKDNLDFENNPDDFSIIVNKIDAEMFGLFSK